MKLWKRLQKSQAVLAVLLVVCMLAGCGTAETQKPAQSEKTTTEQQEAILQTGPVGISEEKDFHSIVMDLSTEELNQMGFAYGDSVDIKFDNGFSLEDVPYHNDSLSESLSLDLYGS